MQMSTFRYDTQAEKQWYGCKNQFVLLAINPTQGCGGAGIAPNLLALRLIAADI